MASTAAEKAEDAKAQGNAAFKAGAYDEAVSHFTTAIEADPTNHVLYSNRSGAYAAKGEFKDALLDANKCIDLKGDWAKGHSRRGAAYFGLKNWIQAQASYERGLELDPNSQVMKDELEKVKRHRNPRAYGGGAAGGGMPGMPGSMAASMPAPSTGTMARTFSFGALMGGLFYAVPVMGARRAFQAYAFSVSQILLLFVVNLWNKNFPKSLATLSDPAFRATQEVQAFMLVIFMLLSPPMPFALMPFLASAFINVLHGYRDLIGKLPAFARTRLEYFFTEEGAFQVHAFGSVSEVIVTFMGPPLAIVQGYRALLLTFFYFQYVSRRYKTAPQTAQVVGLFVGKLDSVATHRFVPAPVQNVYTKAKYYVGIAADKLGN